CLSTREHRAHEGSGATNLNEVDPRRSHEGRSLCPVEFLILARPLIEGPALQGVDEVLPGADPESRVVGNLGELNGSLDATSEDSPGPSQGSVVPDEGRGNVAHATEDRRPRVEPARRVVPPGECRL